MALKRMSSKRAYGIKNALQRLNPLPIVAQRAPLVTDRAEIGTVWIDVPLDDAYFLTSIVANVSTWINAGGGTGTFAALNVTGAAVIGTALTLTAGNLTLGAMAADGVLTNTAAGVVTSNALTDGQMLIGSTGVPPVAATLTAGAGIVIGNAAGAITVTATGAIASNYTASDANNVIPDGLGNLNILGGVNIGTTAAIANTVTIDLDAAPTLAGLLTCQAGITQSAGTTTITSDTNGAEAIYLHANGGVNETIVILADQSTDLASIDITSDVGGISIAAGIASALAISIGALDAAGGVSITSGTGGIAIGATNGAVAITSGTGNMNIGADATDHTSTFGSVTGVSQTVVQSGTGPLALNGGGLITIDCATTLEINSSGGIIGIGNDAVAQNINLGTGAAARTISIGNATAATAIDIDAGTGACSILSNATDHSTTFGSVTGVSALTTQAGTGAMTFTAGGIFDVNAVGAITLDSSAGTIGIGVDADAFAINIGTGASARTITLGNATGATSLVLNAGTGAVNIGANATVHATTVGSLTGASATTIQAGTGAVLIDGGDLVLIDAVADVDINSSTGNINIGNDVVAQNINIGTGASVRSIAIGNATGATDISLDAGTGGIDINNAAGRVSMTPATNTAAGVAITLDARVGVCTLTGNVTGAGVDLDIDITNAYASAGVGVLVTVSNIGGNDSDITIEGVNTATAGHLILHCINSGAAALNGDVIVTFWILN